MAMLQILNCTTFSCLIIAVYVSFIGYKLYHMVNPLSGIEITGISLQCKHSKLDERSLLRSL